MSEHDKIVALRKSLAGAVGTLQACEKIIRLAGYGKSADYVARIAMAAAETLKATQGGAP